MSDIVSSTTTTVVSLSSKLSPFDLTIIILSTFHLLFSLSSSLFLFHFQLKLIYHKTPSSPRIVQLNSLWPIRLLLLLFSCLLSISELLRLPIFSHSCLIYTIISHSFSQPAFFSTLLFLLRSSTNSHSSSFLLSLSLALPFLFLHSILLFFPSPFLPPPPSISHNHCSNPLLSTMLLALLALLYVPLFVAACSRAVTLVINKKLRFRLYALVASVVFALSVQVTTLAFASLWAPWSDLAQGLELVAYVAVLLSVVVGEVILVVMPVVDARAILDISSGLLLVGGKGEDESLI